MTEFAHGHVFVNHRIEGLAGRGGMGVVYRATQLGLDRIVALKVIAPALADEPDFRARFVAESKAAASIEHPNVIPVYYAGEREGVLFIVMRYVDGPDLRALVRAAGTLEPERAAHIVAQVGSALDAAHERGLVHRDVKPANVLLTPDDHAYLTDFGLTKRETAVSEMSRTGGWVGTLGYVAPEQIRGERIDARTDVYALGCVLVHVLTGQAPYVRDSDEATLWAHLNDPPPSESVPPEFAGVVARALSKDPSDRYPSAGDLGRAALAAAGGRSEPRPERVVARGAAAPQDAPQPSPPAPRAATADGETRPSPPADEGWFAATTPTVEVASAPTAQEAPPGPAREPSPGAARQPGPPREASPAAARRPLPALPAVLRGRMVGVAAIIVLAVVAVVVVLTATGGDPATPDRPAAPQRPAGPVLSDPIPVGPRPNALAIAGGSVWAVSAASSDVFRVDADTGERTDRIDIGEGANSIAAGFDSVWVVKGSTGTLLRIDSRTGRRSGPAIQLDVPGQAVAVATGEGAVWVGVRNPDAGYTGPETVVKITPSTGDQQLISVPGGVQDLAVGEKAVWVSNRFRSSVVRIGTTTGTQTEIPVADGPKGLAVGQGAVWVAAEADDAITRINASSRNTTTIALEDTPARVTVGGGSVWVSARAAGNLVRIHPERRRVRDTIKTGRRPFALDVTEGAVWVSLLGEDAVQRVAFRP